MGRVERYSKKISNRKFFKIWIDDVQNWKLNSSKTNFEETIHIPT